jgi:lipid-binding SYLF domain-containing protein
MHYRMLIALGTIMVAGSGCMAPRGGSVVEKRQYVNRMRKEALSKLYAKKPEARQRVDNAVGYGVFAELATSTGIGGGGSGYGVVVNNETGLKSYMRMIQVSGGLGIGLKHFRVIFLFHTRDALNKFVKEGWEVGTEAQAAALLDHKGAGSDATGTFTKGVSVYQLTADGLYIRAALHAKKFFPDTKLNDN